MIEKIKKKKQFIIILVVICLIYLFIKLTGLNLLTSYFINQIKQNAIAEKYKSEEERKKYFTLYESNFNELSNILENDNRIESIGKNRMCSSLEYKFKLDKNIVLCTNENMNESEIIDYSNRIVPIITKMRLINIQVTKVDKEYSEITFNLISTNFYRVYFSYCIDINICSTDSSNFEITNNIFEKNKINESWFSVYSNIPKT